MAPPPRDQILDEFDHGLSALADSLMESFQAAIPIYQAMPEETLRQVRDVVEDNLACVSRCMRRGSDPSGDELVPFRESATRRAHEGVALPAVLEAYRMGARMAWHDLRRITEAHRQPMLGLEFATGVMSYIDTVSAAVAAAYISEFESLASDREAARRDFVDGILDGSLAREEVFDRGEALGLDTKSSYVVCLLALVDSSPEGEVSREKQRRLRSMVTTLPHGHRSLVVNRGQELMAVIPAAAGTEDLLTERLHAFVERAREHMGERVAAGLGGIHVDITELASGYREAGVALAAARGGVSDVAVYGNVVMEELILREPAIARRLSRSVIEPLRTHPFLLETLQEYLRHGPALPEVASRLSVHPNTVAYRLARIKEFTSHDPRTPYGMAQLALALRAAELLGQLPD